MRIVLQLICVLMICPIIWAQDMGVCTTETVRGTYSVTCTVLAAAAAGQPLTLPTVAHIVVTIDNAGNGTATGSINLHGLPVAVLETNRVQVNEDCTASVKADTVLKLPAAFGGDQKVSLTSVAHILENGALVKALALEPGSFHACEWRRIRK